MPPKRPAATSLRNAEARCTGTMTAHEMTKPPVSASRTDATPSVPMAMSERRFAVFDRLRNRDSLV